MSEPLPRLTIQEQQETVSMPGGGPAPNLDSLRHIGDYELLSELGRGGMGVVFKARQQRLNRTVAVKMLLPGAPASSGDLQRFRVEVEATANLQHPHIVRVHEVGDCDGRPFYSMEYIDGPSLAGRRPVPHPDPRSKGASPRFGGLLPTSAAERQLWSIWLGYFVASGCAALIYFQMVDRETISRLLGGREPSGRWSFYPYSALLSGLCFFVMGSAYWGGCYAIGLVFFALAALMPLNMELAPLGFALMWGGTLSLLGLRLRRLGDKKSSDEK